MTQKIDATKSELKVSNYFSYVDRSTARLGDDGYAAGFLNTELTKWEIAQELLHDWQRRRDGSPNPFSPPIEPAETVAIIAGIAQRLGAIMDRTERLEKASNQTVIA